MKAKKINEMTGYDPQDEPMRDERLRDFDEDEYGTITFYYSSGGSVGTLSAESVELAEYFGLKDEEELTNEMIEQYESAVLNPNDIEWEEDEGPNPDDLRDKYMD